MSIKQVHFWSNCTPGEPTFDNTGKLPNSIKLIIEEAIQKGCRIGRNSGIGDAMA